MFTNRYFKKTGIVIQYTAVCLNAKIMIDTISIGYACGVDTILPNGIEKIGTIGISIYPNPTADKLNIGLSSNEK